MTEIIGQTLNPIQVRAVRHASATDTDLNLLTRMMLTQPTVMNAMYDFIFASKSNDLDFSAGNPMEALFGLGKTKMIDDLNWSWKMPVKSRNPITIIENRTTGNTPGRNREIFSVLVDKDYGRIGDSWSPRDSDRSQIAVLKSKHQDGANFVYGFQMYTDGDSNFMKSRHLNPGALWTRSYSFRGEAAESGGGIEISSTIEFKNNLVKLRKQQSITDYAAQAVIQAVMDMGAKFGKERYIKTWFPYALMKIKKEIMKDTVRAGYVFQNQHK